MNTPIQFRTKERIPYHIKRALEILTLLSPNQDETTLQTPEAILRAVSVQSGVGLGKLVGNARPEHIVHYREVAQTLLYERLNIPYREIADLTTKSGNHVTALKAIRRMSEYRERYQPRVQPVCELFALPTSAVA